MASSPADARGLRVATWPRTLAYGVAVFAVAFLICAAIDVGFATADRLYRSTELSDEDTALNLVGVLCRSLVFALLAWAAVLHLAKRHALRLTQAADAADRETDTALQLRALLETLPDAAVLIDVSGRIRGFSAAAERMFGISGQDAIGRCVTDLMTERTAAACKEWLARVRTADGQADIGITRSLLAQRADGSAFPVEIILGKTRSGEQQLLTGVIRDISDRRAVEQRISELDSQLAFMSRQNAMGELAADLAHELNQPLSATANFLATARMLVKRGANLDHVTDAIARSELQVLRAGDIIRRLRDFLVKKEVEKHVDSLELIVLETVNLVLYGAARLEIDIALRLDPVADAVLVDRVQLQQVLVNLLRNAVEVLSTRPLLKRQIVIASEDLDEHFIEVSVADTGPGLPETLDNEFNPRFESDKGSGSMGVGLSISKRIVEAHGGTLRAENRPDGGAIFRFSLPKATTMALI